MGTRFAQKILENAGHLIAENDALQHAANWRRRRAWRRYGGFIAHNVLLDVELAVFSISLSSQSAAHESRISPRRHRIWEPNTRKQGRASPKRDAMHNTCRCASPGHRVTAQPTVNDACTAAIYLSVPSPSLPFLQHRRPFHSHHHHQCPRAVLDVRDGEHDNNNSDEHPQQPSP